MPWPFRTKVAAARLAVKYSSFFVGMGAAKWLSRSYLVLATEGFQNNPVVYSCVTKLAKAASSVDLKLYKRSASGGLKEVKEHAALDLLNNPNPMSGGRLFREKLATQFLIGGNAYIWGNGAKPSMHNPKPPTDLWLLPPSLMQIQGTTRSFMPDGYEYRAPGQGVISYPVDKVTGQSAICHLRTVNPLDEWYGLPPLAAASYGVDIFNSGQAWNKALLQNEGRPSGALQMRADKEGRVPTLSDAQFQRLRAEIDDSYSGPTNAGRPLLLDSALEWVQMSLNAKDMDHRETMLTTARFIAACYGTPPQLVNIPGESTYSNYGQATLAYWSDTVLPFLSLQLEELDRWLLPLFGEKDLFFDYDPEQIPALEPRREELFKRINDAEFLTINEKREATGYAKHKDKKADDILVSDNDIPLEKLGEIDPKIHPELAPDATPKPATDDQPKT